MYVCVGAVLMGGVLVLGVSWRSVSAHKKEGLREAEGSVLSRNLDTATQKWGRAGESSQYTLCWLRLRYAPTCLYTSLEKDFLYHC